MPQNNTVAIYCDHNYNKLINYCNEKYENIILLYDNLSSKGEYDLPRFHYTEVNNLGYDIVIDNLSLYERLKDKNNRIIYYMSNSPNHNISYKQLSSFIQNIDEVIIPSNISTEFMNIVFNYTKELSYV
jgi:hypothetical protein